MIVTNLIPLSQARKYPLRQVGQKSVIFAKLLGSNLPLPAGFILPLETFKKIAHHNGLIPTIETIFETTDWSSDFSSKKNINKIKRLIRGQVIPLDIASEIGKAYKKIAQNNFVKIISSTTLLENIKGETNLIESILELWAQDVSRDNLFLGSQIVMAQFQPDSAGIASFETKQHLTLQFTCGVFDQVLIKNATSDFFIVDVKTLNILSHHINPKKITLKRKLDRLEKTKTKNPLKSSLTDKQIIKIAQLAIKANRQFLGNKKIFFETKGRQIFLTDIADQTHTNLAGEANNPILIGQSVTSGYIENYSQLAMTTAQKKNFITGRVLVTQNLSHLDIDLIKKASAIICEDKIIDRSILVAIKKYHIPCIIGVDFALSKLKTNPKIIINASTGKIFFATSAVLTTQNNPAPKTSTKIYLSAGNPYRADTYPVQSEGIFLKSDYGIAFLGFHPEYLIRTKKNLLARNIFNISQAFLRQKPQVFFYRSCNLNSQELSLLKFAENYEAEELNPYLGIRGALRIIQNPNLFTLELKTIHSLAQKTKKEINFVIPFVRTSTELAIIFKKIDQILPNNHRLKFWLQLNTPANVSNLKEFLHLPLAGVTFGAQTIHDLSYGLDPDNPNLRAYYTFDTNLIISLLTTCAKTLATNLPSKANPTGSLPLIVKLNSFNAQLVSAIVRLGARAIVVKPSLFDIVKQQIIETEEEIILKK